jgi:sugar/nucleoside kinase (ribokinase family)
MKKLVTSGEIVVEIMAIDIGQTFDGPGPLIGPFPSGAPAIFIDQAAKLGQPCGLISSVGDDDFGRLNIDRLKRDGVDISAIAVHAGAATGSAFVRYEHSGARHFVFNIRDSACRLIALTAEAEALLAEADHFQVMGSSLFSPEAVSVARAGIEIVKRNGGTVSFDPNIRKEMLSSPGMRQALDFVLARCDIFLPSGPELFLFTPATDEASAIRDLLSRGMTAIVLKNGADGATYHDNSSTIEMAAFAVEEVDPTGAGDCFGAAFVSLWLRGAAPIEALRFAAACGAMAVTRKGPMEGTASMAEVESYLAQAVKA